MEFTKWVDSQSKGVKILIFFPIWGWIFGFLYRLFAFIETKETAVLLGAILFLFAPTGMILEIVDIIFIILEDKLKVLVPGGENFGIKGTVNFDSEQNTETKDEVKPDYQEVKEEKNENTEETKWIKSKNTKIKIKRNSSSSKDDDKEFKELLLMDEILDDDK